MPKLKNTTINYTSRDFDSIKADLVSHAQRYYPDQVADFTQASFNSMILDSVSYVGDVLSYYLDYSINESFLDTAVEIGNIRKHARAAGFNYSGSPVTYGVVSLFLIVPANSTGTAPDNRYLGTLKKGATFTSATGANFVLLENVRFSDPRNDFIASQFDKATGATTYFAVRAFGQVSSGYFSSIDVDLTAASFEKFRKVKVGGDDVSEIVSVTDSDGNKYYQVDYLSQETIYLETTNPKAKAEGVRSILKPYVTARRFVLEQDSTGTYLQFGFGSENDDDAGLADPSQVVLNLKARNHITDSSFDPSNLLGTDKLGISPSGTRLKIIYKHNGVAGANRIGANQLTEVLNSKITFENEADLDNSQLLYVRSSLEVTNPDPFTGDSAKLNAEELRQRTKTVFASQNRAVTTQDYRATIYRMPSSFGSIKRVQVIQDPNAINRRIAVYVISEDQNNELSKTHPRTKSNLKVWLNRYRAVNDIVDIFDARVLNFKIDFEVAVDLRFNTQQVLNTALSRVREKYSTVFEIGEPIYLNDIRNILSETRGVINVLKLRVENIHSGKYSPFRLDFQKIKSKDGTIIIPPKNVILEMKYPNLNIKGVAK